MKRKPESEMDRGFMFGGLCACRNNQIALRWQISALLGTINAAAITFWATQIHNPWVRLLLGMVASFMNFLWPSLNDKSQQWLDYWNRALSQLEAPETELAEQRVFSGQEWKEINRSPTFHFYLNLIAYGFIVAWILLSGIQFTFPERK